MTDSRRKRSLISKMILAVVAILVTVSLAPGDQASITKAAGENKLFLPLVSSGGVPSRLGVWLGTESSLVEPLKATGAKWTRVILAWKAIEPVYTEPPTYNFSGYDSFLAAIGNAGISPIVAIQGNPSWAADTRCGPINKRLDRFGDFLRALVSRYKDPPYNIKHWEFYNEPENKVDVPWGDFLGGCFGNTPDKYVDVLRTAQTAIKQADPEAKVVFGGLAFGQYKDPATGQLVFNTDFFAQTLALNAGAYFDIANLHYFSSQSAQWAAYGQDIAGKVNYIRQLMASYGVSKPVLVTELSWTNSPYSEEEQARYVPKALARGLSLDLYAMTWFLLRDWGNPWASPTAPDYQDYPYGLMDLSLNHRLAYSVYQTTAAEFGNAAFVRTLLPAEVGVAGGIEGYVFNAKDQTRWVLWSQSGQIQVQLPAHASAKDKVGTAIPLNTSGPTTITLSESPIFVRLSP